jgi:hypothetical protein
MAAGIWTCMIASHVMCKVRGAALFCRRRGTNTGPDASPAGGAHAGGVLLIISIIHQADPPQHDVLQLMACAAALQCRDTAQLNGKSV